MDNSSEGESRSVLIITFLNKFKFFFFTLAMALFLVPYLYLGSEARLMVQDNLDSNFVWYKLLLESGALFADNSQPIYNIFNGLPRISLPSEFDAFVPMYALFGPYGAYTLNRVLMTLVGFFGMYFLLKRHVIPGQKNTLIQFGVAICFAFLPHWPFGGLSVAGIPITTFAFLNIREKDYTWYNWAILLVFPAYSDLVLSGFFLLSSLGLLWIYDFARKKRSIAVPVALAILALAYIATNYRLFLGFLFDSDFLSHRVEFAMRGIDFGGSLRESLAVFLNNDFFHAQSLHYRIIFPVVVLGLFLLAWCTDKPMRKKYILILGFIAAASLGCGLLKWKPVADGLMPVLMQFIPIRLSRIQFLHPTLWMLLFAVALSKLARISRNGLLIVVGIMTAQILYAGKNHELISYRAYPTVAAFFAEKQFRSISEYIGVNKKDYRVVSLGIPPSIAQYNGFYTLDGYFPNYPLWYKHQFRRIIAGELDKNSELRDHFDRWGSRAYFFSSELWDRENFGLDRRAGNKVEVSHLDIDWGTLRSMGGRYILSAVKINEENNSGIKLKAFFKEPSSAWDIYLYEVKANPAESVPSV